MFSHEHGEPVKIDLTHPPPLGGGGSAWGFDLTREKHFRSSYVGRTVGSPATGSSMYMYVHSIRYFVYLLGFSELYEKRRLFFCRVLLSPSSFFWCHRTNEKAFVLFSKDAFGIGLRTEKRFFSRIAWFWWAREFLTFKIAFFRARGFGSSMYEDTCSGLYITKWTSSVETRWKQPEFSSS